MNTKIGILFLALLIGMAGIVSTMAAKEKPTDPEVGGFIHCNECYGLEEIDVYNKDIGGIIDGGWEEWKTTNTDCDTPQCGIDEGQDGDNLVDPFIYPYVNFSKYHAQVGCIGVGGRLPTKEELALIYENRVSLGNNFAHLYYWSSTEYNTKMAYYQAFRSGKQSFADKDTKRYMRCVRTNSTS